MRDLALGLIAFAIMLPLALVTTGLVAPGGYEDMQAYSQGHIDSSHNSEFPSWAEQQAACTETTKSDDPQTRREKNDLCAQFRGALASEKMVWLTSRQIYIGWLEFGALTLTLFFTGWAAVAASNAAKAAERAVEQNEEVSRKQLRAYLGITSCTAEVLSNPSRVQARIMVKNGGQTAARNVSILGGLVYLTNENKEIDIDAQFGDDWSPEGMLAPAESITHLFMSDPVTYLANRDALLSRDMGLILALRIVYDDVFEDEHFIQMARLFDVDEGLCSGPMMDWAQDESD